MAQDDDPLISIITVNFNGKIFLRNLFDSILRIDYPSEKIQIIMVDNDSTDGSVEFVRKEFPQVEIIALDKNKGYSGGNNEGFKYSKGEYIVLINNDCVVEKDWLCEMLFIFRQSADNSGIGAVGSKVVFYYPYLPLQLIADSKNQKEVKNNNEVRRLGIRISDLRVTGFSDDSRFQDTINKSIKYPDGFYPEESDSDGVIHRWSKGNAILAVPIGDLTKSIELQFKASSYISPNNLRIVIGEEILEDIRLSGKPRAVKIKIPKRFFIYRKDIINSCGIKINKSLYSRDRGFESFDEGQYNRVEEIFGLSGSSVMMDRRMLEDIGCFDEKFFTYYEDIDLFWRSRLAGWKNFFTPKSVVRHFHCGTSKEWSYDFTYYVLRNRLLMIFKCGWPFLFIRSYLAFVLTGIIGILYCLADLLKGIKHRRIDIPIRIRIFFELFYMLPRNLVKRIRIRNGSKVQDRIIKSWMRSF
ncbi:MAG: glycosyltransferase family 2 protein [Actinomycetota bacterium]|nr:glycosyltransferase family 2 protein [Actinomycetota bacterium]